MAKSLSHKNENIETKQPDTIQINQQPIPNQSVPPPLEDKPTGMSIPTIPDPLIFNPEANIAQEKIKSQEKNTNNPIEETGILNSNPTQTIYFQENPNQNQIHQENPFLQTQETINTNSNIEETFLQTYSDNSIDPVQETAQHLNEKQILSSELDKNYKNEEELQSNQEIQQIIDEKHEEYELSNENIKKPDVNEDETEKIPEDLNHEVLEELIRHNHDEFIQQNGELRNIEEENRRKEEENRIYEEHIKHLEEQKKKIDDEIETNYQETAQNPEETDQSGHEAAIIASTPGLSDYVDEDMEKKNKLRRKLDDIQIEKLRKEETNEDPEILSHKPSEGESSGGFDVKIRVKKITWKIFYCKFSSQKSHPWVVQGKTPAKNYRCPVPPLEPDTYNISISHNQSLWIEVGTIKMKGSPNHVLLIIFFLGLSVGGFSLYKAFSKFIRRYRKNKMSDDLESYVNFKESKKTKGNRLSRIATL